MAADLVREPGEFKNQNFQDRLNAQLFEVIPSYAYPM